MIIFRIKASFPDEESAGKEGAEKNGPTPICFPGVGQLVSVEAPVEYGQHFIALTKK